MPGGIDDPRREGAAGPCAVHAKSLHKREDEKLVIGSESF